MAQMLRDEDSTDRHLSVTRRHLRRCRKMRGAEGLVEHLTPFRNGLQEHQTQTEARADALEDAQDDLELAGLESADLVRTVAGRAEEYDRQNPGDLALIRVIPSGRFGDLIRSDGSVDPTDLDTMATAITKFPPEHPLLPFGAQLTDQATTYRASDQAAKEARRQLRLAQTEEELAQADLRREYETNYLEARKLFRGFVERLFPKFRSSNSRASRRAAKPPAAPIEPPTIPDDGDDETPDR